MSQSDRSFSEKRDFIRMRLDTNVTLRYLDQEIVAKCIDLSSTGMQLEADSTLQVGDRVQVLISSSHAELKSLEADAEVIRVSALADGKQAVGLSILSMS
ncbi:PilZ domain-containing protein [Pseudomonas matsuisoli]|uniref:Pilus assembly protein n=1 Tax=Pseudomonas matsuisoli TaxID=1515666 RepID=A0A917PI02_9PSED|nr:PilZ domain-containing protein [Pseudomonas matsuisoli]GGJ78845.1 pilus assembly protein [Pseudomonas matsuisoli]